MVGAVLELLDSAPLDVEGDLLGDAAEGHLTGHLEFLGHPHRLHGLEVQGGDLGHIEQFGAADVVVAHGVAGVERVQVNGGLDGGGAVGVDHEAGLEVVEPAADLGNAQVTYREVHGGMGDVEVPGTGGEGALLGSGHVHNICGPWSG